MPIIDYQKQLAFEYNNLKMSTRIQVTIVPKEAGEVIDDILATMIRQVTAPPLDVQGQTLGQLVPHVYNEGYKVHQGQCYQQNSPNLCGYHAIFNTFCLLKMLQGGKSEYDLQSGASFWKFKTKVEAFLLDTKRKHNLADEWPWREKDILYGDFERTYNQVCMEKFEQFSIFRKHQNFYYLSHTWEFQYQNLIGSQASKDELNTKFAQFRNYQGEKPLVLHLMLAITTHWLTFLAIKNSDATVEYWFFDSFNNHYLDFDWQQILDYIQIKNEERLKFKKPALTNFQKESYSMCMKDIQTSLKLIISSIEGTDNIEAYSYNRQFNIFAYPLEAAMCVGKEEGCQVVKEFKHDIKRFFGRSIDWNMLYPDNSAIMNKIIEFGGQVKNYSSEGKLLYSCVSQGNPGIFAKLLGRF